MIHDNHVTFRFPSWSLNHRKFINFHLICADFFFFNANNHNLMMWLILFWAVTPHSKNLARFEKDITPCKYFWSSIEKQLKKIVINKQTCLKKVSKCFCKVLVCSWMSASNTNFLTTKNVLLLLFFLWVLSWPICGLIMVQKHKDRDLTLMEPSDFDWYRAVRLVSKSLVE